MGLPHRHPSVTCYESHGCRCIECKKLASTKREKRKFGKSEPKVLQHIHPSLTCYKTHGCRCAECKELCRNSRYVIPNVLSIEEVRRLRRLVGLPENVTHTET